MWRHHRVLLIISECRSLLKECLTVKIATLMVLRNLLVLLGGKNMLWWQQNWLLWRINHMNSVAYIGQLIDLHGLCVLINLILLLLVRNLHLYRNFLRVPSCSLNWSSYLRLPWMKLSRIRSLIYIYRLIVFMLAV